MTLPAKHGTKLSMFGLFPQKKLRVELPKGQRIIAIGDIHGQWTRLDVLMSRVDKYRKDKPAEQEHIIFLGDYVDRGPHSAHIIEYLRTRRKAARALGRHKEIFLHGNHEELLLEGLETDGTRHDLWWRNGGMQTVSSYLEYLDIKIDNDLDPTNKLELFRAHFPKKHLKFMHKLKNIYSVGPFVFAHAGLRMQGTLNSQKPQDLRWIRDPFLNWEGQNKEFLVVHGHSITKGFKPEICKHRVGIDTGSYKLRGRITAAIFEKDTVRFISSGTKKEFTQNNFS